MWNDFGRVAEESHSGRGGLQIAHILPSRASVEQVVNNARATAQIAAGNPVIEPDPGVPI